MATEQRHLIWAALARELVQRQNIRPAIKDRLQRALERKDPAELAAEVQSVLAQSITDEGRKSTSPQPEPSREAAIQAARHTLSLLEHGTKQLASSASPRLALFMRETLLAYAEAYDRAQAPEGLEHPDAVTQRTLDLMSEQNLATQRARVGILTPGEVAALASQRLQPSQAPTIHSSGDVALDIQSWQASGSIPEERKRALRESGFQDGDLLLTLIRPGAGGQVVEVHPLTSKGRPTPRPIAQFEIAGEPETVSVAEVVIMPSILEDRKAMASPALFSPEQLARPDFRPLAELRDTAISLNQTRVELYATMLSNRPDLTETERKEAERQLAQIERESIALANAPLDLESLSAFLSRWETDLTRDTSRYAQSPLRQMEGLSRLGALQARLNDLSSMTRGAEPAPAAYSNMGEFTELVRPPQSNGTSIFDQPGTALGQNSLNALRTTAAGEELSARVTLRDAERSTPPSRDSHDYLQSIAAAGQRLQQALSNQGALGEAGLQLSSQLQPLLRAERPVDIRPDLSSPMLRNVFLPAMGIISGQTTPRARLETGATPRSLSAEALYGLLLGEEGLHLLAQRPDIASITLGQMGSLAKRLQAAGRLPSYRTLSRAGETIRAQIAELAQTDGQASAAISPGAPSIAATAGLVEDDYEDPRSVEDVARMMEEESQRLPDEIRARIEPFVKVGTETRIYSGPLATAALGAMGARGATVGSDIYVRDDIMARGGAEAAAVVGHEAVHAKKFGGSVESQEAAAYAIEQAIRDKFTLAKDDVEGDSVGVEDVPPAPISIDELMPDLAEMVAELMATEIEEEYLRFGR